MHFRDVFLEGSSFNLILELVSSFSRKRYRSIRKCEDLLGIGIGTNNIYHTFGQGGTAAYLSVRKRDGNVRAVEAFLMV